MQFGIGLVARGKHYVTFGPDITKRGPTAAVVQKDIAQQLHLAPWIFLTKSTKIWDSIIKEFSGLTRPLPRNVQILTLEPWKNSERRLLLRLEHYSKSTKIQSCQNMPELISTVYSVSLTWKKFTKRPWMVTNR
ncbi:hypothetical protein AMK59_8289 [Oryctes borbonicus]|uniref:Uncharacterized protein n=1 Tax=Oryctes borbonicus TaxID=1629725 RepID=A0A0T6AWE8_9SCAR|nr:hypothetical protein AMK59_8289 [Oryctes borbonicus]